MNAFLLIFVSFVFLAACEGCSTSVREAAEAARAARAAIAIGNERVRINGLGIGSSEAQVINALGRPKTATDGFSEVEVSPSRDLVYDGIEIHLVGDRIYNLRCQAPRCVTYDGIKVGDSKEQILAIYGTVTSFQQEDGTEVIRYPMAGADIELVFSLRHGRIFEIVLFYDFV